MHQNKSPTPTHWKHVLFLKHLCGPNPFKCNASLQNLPSVWSRCHMEECFQLSPCAAPCSLGLTHRISQGYYSRKQMGALHPLCNKSFKDIEITALPPHSLRSVGNPVLGLRTTLGPSVLAGLNVWRGNRWESKGLRAELTGLLILPATKPHSLLLP